jgi:hypothetical protein
MVYRLILGCFLLSAAIIAADHAAAATVLDAGKIKAALATAKPEEDGFIDRIVKLTEEGRLPMSLVESTLQWARKKPQYKFQYFKRALTLRAAKIRVAL